MRLKFEKVKTDSGNCFVARDAYDNIVVIFDVNNSDIKIPSKYSKYRKDFITQINEFKEKLQ